MARKPTTVSATPNEIIRPGGPFKSCAAAISQAVRIIKPGLRNSDGCTDAKPKENQRTAPLPKSVPKIGSKASATKDARNPRTPIRRTISGDIMEKSTITTIATPPKKA